MGYNAKAFAFIAGATAVGAAILAPIVRNVAPNSLTNIGS